MKNKLFIVVMLLITINQFGYANPDNFAYVLMPGEYYILADGVRIRSQPNLNGEIIGRLSVNSKIKVISSEGYGGVYQEIDGVSAYWYEIEYENITGYIWGGFISARTLVYDIDNNGIYDYFHYRVSRIVDPHFNQVDSYKDVIIYINNRKIETTNIVSGNSRGITYHTWGDVFFEPTERNTVLITMYFSAPYYTLQDIFEIDRTGRIVFKEKKEEHGGEY